MSMKLMTHAMSIKVGNPLRKLILLKLADNANDQGECWPSVPYIAHQCEMTDRSVQKHLHQLAVDGLLWIEYRKNEQGVNKSNVYHLTLNNAPKVKGENKSPGRIQVHLLVNQERWVEYLAHGVAHLEHQEGVNQEHPESVILLNQS
ncbi:hypothetical protein CCS41_05575 [Candidatus Fukatsuia symbiotica]|uniref:Helix-turn-helix domain-containing protein n=1 Tax=Candidatus Fukatsuia symbiotica TaxID=1878942 RepID=A0A2U8I4J1_9GAMM|nr:helix-turn-helix domain-containing protein [Candidatus Fukatsuia symbiotica]AWK14070.1 hypothetical protein CCS41_05575 [Candidatus Fukatsuia symbiotica]